MSSHNHCLIATRLAISHILYTQALGELVDLNISRDASAEGIETDRYTVYEHYRGSLSGPLIK